MRSDKGDCELMSLKLEDIMARNVIRVGEKVTAIKAVEIMNKQGIGCLIAVRKEKPTGIITERDILKKILVKSKDPRQIKVREIMSSPLILGNPQMGMEEAVRLMFKRNIKKLPVSDGENLVGLVTLTDLVRSKGILKVLKRLPAEETPKRMVKIVDRLNRITAVSRPN